MSGGAEPPAERSDLDRLLARVRGRYRRVDARHAAAAVLDGGALLVDIRPEAERARHGAVPTAVVVDRADLEWQLAPSGPRRLPQLRADDQTVIVMCAEGDASSLAVASLRDLGLSGATDLVGGFRAWKDAGLPVTPAHRPRALPFAAV